jgi:hypothetical protein
MAERVVEIEFLKTVKSPHIVTERVTGGMVGRLLYKDRPFTVVQDGPYVRITGTGCTIKVPHANIAFMAVEDASDEPKKAGGK